MLYLYMSFSSQEKTHVITYFPQVPAAILSNFDSCGTSVTVV